MTMTLACKDTGMKECPYVARGQNMEELMNNAGTHAKKAHGYTDEQLNDPETLTTLKKVIKTEQNQIQHIFPFFITHIWEKNCHFTPNLIIWDFSGDSSFEGIFNNSMLGKDH